MLAADQVPVKQRVRCRQIEEGDLEALAVLFHQGFPPIKREAWADGLARMRSLPVIEGVPRYGYVLEGTNGLVGGLLTISSRRGEQIISNVSAWYVQESYRAYSNFLVSVATRLKHVIYLNSSPAQHTWRTLTLTGWKFYDLGRSAAFPVPGWSHGRVSETIPGDLPERKLLEDHRALGCVSLVCTADGVASPFVFKRRWWGRLKLPMMQLIYCRGAAEFEKYGPTLGRYFLLRKPGRNFRKRVSFGFLLEGKVKGMPSYYQEGREPCFYKGPRPPQHNDFAYTEKVVFE
jgi:hypothetical protein